LTALLCLAKATVVRNGNYSMLARLHLSVSIVTLLALPCAAQQIQVPDTPKAVKPKSAAPKPKPAAAKPTSPAVPSRARLIDKIGDWSVFVHDDPAGRVCFAASAPSETLPKTAKRAPVIFYVTSWQKDGVKNEVSVKLGYAIKAKSNATVTAGGKSFALPAGDDDKAYTKDANDEKRLLTAMAAGGSMVVKATSAKGTATVDQYSLEGAAAAVQKLQDACP
jgi:hypothetical protein